MPEIIAMGGLTLRFLHSGEDTGGSLDMFEMDLRPNARMPVPHAHSDWEETVYGVEGTTTFTVDGKAVPLRPGDSVFIPRGVVHGFDNLSGSPARCLCVLTPGKLGPGYFRELAALLAVTPPDREAMAEVMLRHGLIPAPD